MAKNPQIYFSSDWHFNHWSEKSNRGIITFERTQFDNIREHDDFMVGLLTAWANTWTPGSELWYLGDFGSTDYLWVFDMFRGNDIAVHFLLGNHDRQDSIPLITPHVDDIYEYPVWLSKKLVLSHEPVAVYEDTCNVHGHLHGSKLKDVNHVNASIHVADYKPISEKNVSSVFSQLPKYNRRFLYEPYAEDYIFTQEKEDVVMDRMGRIDLSASRLLMRMNTEKRKANDDPYQPYAGGR